MRIETRNIIGNKFSSGTGEILQGVNPISNTFIDDSFCIASEQDVENAMKKARMAFPSYSVSKWDQRANFLETIAQEIESLGSELINRTSEETGLPRARIIGERGRTVGQLRMFAAFIKEGNWVEATIDTAIPNREPLPRTDIRKMMVALGPVVVFGSSNFPLAYSVAGGDTAAALAAGCPVVVKAHPAHPGTSALVGNAIITAAKKCNMPDGVFSLLFDNEFNIGRALVEHPSTSAVGFTGSIAGGRALLDMASKRKNPIPIFAEMGSINPVVLLPEALKMNSEKIAVDFAGSISLGVGQFCTNPGLLLGMKGADFDNFKSYLVTAFSKISPEPMLHAGIEKAYKQKSNALLAESKVEVLAKSDKEASLGKGRPMVTIAKGSEFIENPLLQEEVFGPFSLLIECEDKIELDTCLGELEGQLTGTVMGEYNELREFSKTINLLQQKVGRLIFNGVPTGVEVCPSMQHGGPYPSSTDSRFTAVGVHSIKRFIRPVSFQNMPDSLLPTPLKNENPKGLLRFVNGTYSTASI